jgi:hypothetical protein
MLTELRNVADHPKPMINLVGGSSMTELSANRQLRSVVQVVFLYADEMAEPRNAVSLE